ncbi:M67 family metallopeptidase [Paenibacillus kobensis]|uniref:M67 family metallopeptidase n=1 Tax=Paenibacillus kobensis TaxID=59841 RepID=UPI0013E2C65D|nr:M67 family metallopeptidase [Paenibacillus kobensis]
MNPSSHRDSEPVVPAATSNEMKLTISHDIYISIAAHCESDLPNEACGLLISSRSSLAVERFIPIPNRHPQPRHSFSFDPMAWTSAIYELDRLGQKVIGYYHSHPSTPAIPSVYDAAGLPGSGSALMLILSFASPIPEARAYQLTRGAYPDTILSEINLIID